VFSGGRSIEFKFLEVGVTEIRSVLKMSGSGALIYENLEWNNPSIKSFYSGHAASLITAMNIQKDEFVMDYGCGGGSFTETLASSPDNSPRPITLFGVDINEKMIEFAKSKSSHPSINYSVGNIMDENNWNFEMQEMDKVFAMIVLPYIQDYKTFLKKIYNLLNAGGLFGGMFPVGRQYALGVELAKTAKWRNYNRKAYNSPGMADWFCKDVGDLPPIKQELESCGFNLLEYKVHSNTLEFDSIHEFYEFLIAVNPTLGHVPEEFHNELIQDLDAIAPYYLEGEFPRNVEPFEYDWHSVRFVAQKPTTKTIIHLF
jgi:ubiquinone/menaquinone biosynthesis C-methylase UbiE